LTEAGKADGGAKLPRSGALPARDADGSLKAWLDGRLRFAARQHMKTQRRIFADRKASARAIWNMLRHEANS
jgi:hypothetical protein